MADPSPMPVGIRAKWTTPTESIHQRGGDSEVIRIPRGIITILIDKSILRVLHGLVVRIIPTTPDLDPPTPLLSSSSNLQQLQQRVPVTWIPIVQMPLPSSGAGHHQKLNSFLVLG